MVEFCHFFVSKCLSEWYEKKTVAVDHPVASPSLSRFYFFLSLVYLHLFDHRELERNLAWNCVASLPEKYSSPFSSSSSSTYILNLTIILIFNLFLLTSFSSHCWRAFSPSQHSSLCWSNPSPPPLCSKDPQTGMPPKVECILKYFINTWNSFQPLWYIY